MCSVGSSLKVQIVQVSVSSLCRILLHGCDGMIASVVYLVGTYQIKNSAEEEWILMQGRFRTFHFDTFSVTLAHHWYPL